MSTSESGSRSHLRGRSDHLPSLIVAVAVLLAATIGIAQESPGVPVPGPQPGGAQHTSVVEVTFVDPFGITEASDLQVGVPYPNRANVETDSNAGGTKIDFAFGGGSQVPASLTVTAAPRQPISILVDDVISGSGYSLTDFRCKYDVGSATACDGPGYSETSVPTGTLLVAATVVGNGTRLPGAEAGSFAVTISYQ